VTFVKILLLSPIVGSITAGIAHAFIAARPRVIITIFPWTRINYTTFGCSGSTAKPKEKS
jgi:hypothetical protein